MNTPNVLTVIIEKNSNFTLKAFACRPLNETEKRESLKQWLRSSKKKGFPKNGSGEIVTFYGFDEF